MLKTDTMQKISEKPGSVLGGTLLISGSCIGAGMLGLPILTGMAGFFPSLLMFTLSCLFMTATGLLLVEVGQWFQAKSNFNTIVADLLGPFGRIFCWILYLFLFYALLVAYIADSGHHASSLLESIFQTSFPVWFGSIFFVAIFGWFVYLGTKSVDLLNRVLMLAKIVTYIGLIALSIQYVKPSLLEYSDPKYTFFPIPILVISFGFHNMIPTLSGYLGGDTKRIRLSIIGGALFTLVIYLFWQIIALGSLPVEGANGILASYKKGMDAAAALKQYSHHPAIGSFAFLLAFFAILTSFLAQSLSLVHFLSDGMKVHPKNRENLFACLIALVPALAFAIIKPDVFYKALGFAGICAVILFGLFPIFMIWIGRYQRKNESPYQVKGGKKILYVLLAGSLFLICYQVSQLLGLNIFPTP